MFLNYRAKCTRARAFSRLIFPSHFVDFLFSYLLPFFGFLCSFTEMKADTVCARAQAAILRSSGHSIKEIAKLLKKTEWWVNKWSKRKSFKDKLRSERPSVLTNCARNVIKKAKFKRNNSTKKIAKNLQHHNIKVSSTTVGRYMTSKGWKAFMQAKEDTTVK